MNTKEHSERHERLAAAHLWMSKTGRGADECPDGLPTPRFPDIDSDTDSGMCIRAVAEAERDRLIAEKATLAIRLHNCQVSNRALENQVRRLSMQVDNYRP